MASVSNQVSPAIMARAVTPADATALTGGPCRAIYVGGAGNVTIVPVNDNAGIAGTAVTFVGCYAGMILPVMAISIDNTNTTATSIVALY